jgi:hypothetical protein
MPEFRKLFPNLILEFRRAKKKGLKRGGSIPIDIGALFQAAEQWICHSPKSKNTKPHRDLQRIFSKTGDFGRGRAKTILAFLQEKAINNAAVTSVFLQAVTIKMCVNQSRHCERSEAIQRACISSIVIANARRACRNPVERKHPSRVIASDQ